MTLRLGGDGAITGCTSLENPDLTVSGLTISGSFDAEKVLVSSGTAAAPSYTFSGDTDNGLYYAGTNSVGVSTAGTSAIVVDASQQVGIGTASPQLKFVVSNSGANGFEVDPTQDSGGTTGINSYNRSGSAFTNLRLNASSHQFDTSSTTRMVINSSGRVGIGTTSPGQPLAVVATSSTYKGMELITPTGDGSGEFIFGVHQNGSTAGRSIVFKRGGSDGTASESLRIDSSGRLLLGTTSAPAGTDAQYTKFALRGNTLNSNASYLSLGNNKSTTNTTSDDNLGIITFNDNDSDAGEYARITGATDGANATNDYPGKLIFATTSDGASGPSERMRIDSSGKVGININNPGSYNSAGNELVVGNTSNNGGLTIVSSTTNNGHIFFADGTSGGALNRGIIKYEHGNDAMAFNTAETERMRIDSSGLVLIGTTAAGWGNAADNLTIADTDNCGITIRAGTSTSASSIYFADGTTTAENYAGFIDYQHNGDHLRFGTNGGQERMRIDSSGRLLVGTSSTVDSDSTALLQTSASGGARLALGNPNTVGAGSAMMGQVGFYGYQGAYALSASISAHASATWSTNDYPTRLTFNTTADGASSPTERMRIGPTGMVRVRGTDASGALNVYSSIGGSTSANLILGQHSASDITSGTLSFLVYTNGNVLNANNSYGSLSDVNLKENIVDANSQWADIKGVRVRNYNFKEETGNETFKQLGVVAQEVEEVSPGLVNTNEDGIKSVNYSVLYMKAVKALQEAMARIETLEAEVAALKNN